MHRLPGPVGVAEIESHRLPDPIEVLHDQRLVQPELTPNPLQGLLVHAPSFIRPENIECHIAREQPHDEKNQRDCPQQRRKHQQNSA